MSVVELLRRNREAVESGTVTLSFCPIQRSDLVEAGQKSQLILVSCADSRVIPEVIFNSGMGEILMTRDAGNTIGDAEYAIIHYGVFALGINIIAVMGHSHCGVVTAALAGNADPHMAVILEKIRESIISEGAIEGISEAEMERAAKLNVLHQVKWLTEHEILGPLVVSRKVSIHGLYYNQETGLVEEL